MVEEDNQGFLGVFVGGLPGGFLVGLDGAVVLRGLGVLTPGGAAVRVGVVVSAVTVTVVGIKGRSAMSAIEYVYPYMLDMPHSPATASMLLLLSASSPLSS